MSVWMDLLFVIVSIRHVCYRRLVQTDTEETGAYLELSDEIEYKFPLCFCQPERRRRTANEILSGWPPVKLRLGSWLRFAC